MDCGTHQLDPGVEISLVNAGINLPVYGSQDIPLDIGITASTLPFTVNLPPTQIAFEGYSLCRDPYPNTQIIFSEVARQRKISERQRLASSWNKVITLRLRRSNCTLVFTRIATLYQFVRW